MIGFRRKSFGGFTLTEVIVSLAIIGIVAGGIIAGYIQSARFTDWQAHSLAAHSLAMQRVEQCRSAKWDTRLFPVVDQLTEDNFPTVTERLSLPTGGNQDATIYTQISDVTADPPLRMIQADCVWRSMDGKFFTNTVVTYRAPDQ